MLNYSLHFHHISLNYQPYFHLHSLLSILLLILVLCRYFQFFQEFFRLFFISFQVLNCAYNLFIRINLYTNFYLWFLSGLGCYLWKVYLSYVDIVSHKGSTSLEKLNTHLFLIICVCCVYFGLSCGNCAHSGTNNTHQTSCNLDSIIKSCHTERTNKLNRLVKQTICQ